MTTTTSGAGHTTGRSGNPTVDREDNRRTIPDRRINDPDRIKPTPGNLRLLHETADRLGEGRPIDDPITQLRTLDSRTAMPILKRTMSDAQIQEARWYGGWNPDRDDCVRVNEDGDLEGLTRAQADQLVWSRRNDIIDTARDESIDAETMTTLDAMADRTEMPDQPDLDNPDREEAHGTIRRSSRSRNGGH